MHTNKYLEKIAEYDWNNAPKDMGIGYGIAGVISPAIGAYMGLRDNNEKIRRLKADAGYKLGLQSHLDEVDTILSRNRKVLKILPAIMASSGAIVGGVGYMAGKNIRDRQLSKDLNKQAEHPSDDVATTTLINKITNPISWAAKIDLAGNTSTRVAALALNTLAREASKSDEHHNIPGPIQYRV